jgi:hypothetical protein
MQPTKELLSRLKADYPDITFVVGDDFKWSKTRRELTVTLNKGGELYMLHELAHALLGHADFDLDIELLKQEREAWDHVRASLAPRYGVTTDDDLIEDALDTYREWLHARSLCPSCGLTGLQTKTSTYVCINCRCSWRPNDARRVELRRYKIT